MKLVKLVFPACVLFATLAITTGAAVAASPAVPVAGEKVKSKCDPNAHDYNPKLCAHFMHSSTSIPIGGTKVKSKCDPNALDYNPKLCENRLRRTSSKGVHAKR